MKHKHLSNISTKQFINRRYFLLFIAIFCKLILNLQLIYIYFKFYVNFKGSARYGSGRGGGHPRQDRKVVVSYFVLVLESSIDLGNPILFTSDSTCESHWARSGLVYKKWPTSPTGQRMVGFFETRCFLWKWVLTKLIISVSRSV